MPPPFQIGNVIEVVSPECPDFVGKQGAVTDIDPTGRHKDGPIRVRFPTLYRDLARWVGDRDRYTIWFEPTDLQVRPSGFRFDPKEEGQHLWSGMAHTYIWPKRPLLPGKTKCHFQGCDRPAFFEIWYNFLGTATKWYVCGEHASFHYKAGECEDFTIKGLPVEESQSDEPPLLSVAELSKIIFGETWQVKRPLTFFIPGETLCVHADCKFHARLRILVNCWGSVYQMDVCPQHAHLHGSRLDQVPYKPEIGQLEFVTENQIDLSEIAMA